MKGRDALREMLNGSSPTHPAAVAPQRSAGAVRAMSLGLQHLSDEAAATKSLRDSLVHTESIAQLNPSDIDPSLVSDRIPLEVDPAFEELKAAIAEKGQQVPILVRPNPRKQGRYEIAYGRRRLRAARELDITIKALVRHLSDRELIVAQAQENGPRTDLSFIERALFAANLETHGFDRDTITTVLHVDKPELSRLLTVARSITGSIITAIGPAHKVGRPRWLALAERCEQPRSVEKLAALIVTPRFQGLDTNARFSLALAELVASSPSEISREEVTTRQGQLVAWLERRKGGVRLSSEHPSFVNFLEKRLPALLREFEIAAQQGGES
jgi:ParB family transcriptional regulator, chromosome partitioning protein